MKTKQNAVGYLNRTNADANAAKKLNRTNADANAAAKVKTNASLRCRALRITLAMLLALNTACITSILPTNKPTLANAATLESISNSEQQISNSECHDSSSNLADLAATDNTTTESSPTETKAAATSLETSTADLAPTDTSTIDLAPTDTSTIELAPADNTTTDIPYLDINGQPQTTAQATTLDGSEATLSTGWYLATGALDYLTRITISGEVHLILADGATMQANRGIGVSTGSTLNIYAQSLSNGAGSLFSTSSSDLGHAGLGGNSESDAGNIVIAGGNIVAKGSGAGGAAIGGGFNSSGGSVTIMGGYVDADGNGGGAGIGSGNGNAFKVLKGGTIIIGGTAVVEAYGGTNTGLGGSAAGIGGGGMPTGTTSIGASSGNITIKDRANVTAVGGNAPRGNGGAGIGGGGSAAGGGSSAGKIDHISITTTGAVIAMGGTGYNPGAGIGTGGGLDVGTGKSEDYPKITATAGAGGSISPAGELTVIGSDITFNITPDNNHLIESVVVDGKNLGAINSYSFSSITGEHTISASFLSKNYDVKLSVTGTHNFANASYGYPQTDITPLEVSITNIGNTSTGKMDVTLSGKDASAFSLSSNELTDVAPGLSERFSVFPITGLSCSTYNATVTVSNDNGVSAAFDVNFHVEKTLQLPLEISGLKASYTYGDTPVALQTTGGSGTGSVSYTSSNTTVASIVNESISFHKAGTFTITASKAEDNNYLATSVTSELVSVVSAAPNVALSAYGGKSDDVSGGTSVGESDNTSGRISVVKSDDASGRISVVKSDDASGDISGSTTTLDNITLHCIVAPAGNGNVPQGNVRFFCDGEAISNAIPLNSLGEANMQVGALSVGEHQFSVEYLGQPDYYLSGSATLLHTVVLSQQQPLEINGIPEQINYGDAKFTIAANGGSGSGDLKFSAINDNGVVKIGAVTGARASITIVGAGQTTITVTKAADDIYAQASKQIDISVAPRDIANVSLSVSNNPIYTGKQLCPVVDVSDDATIIASDYDINYGTNIMAGEKSGSVTLTGKRNYTGSKTVTFSILKRSLSGASITLSNTAFAYTGTAIKPTVLAIEVDGINVNSSEYELNYANNINTGFATVTAVAKTDGNFSGSAIAVFAIGSQFDASIGGINGGTGSEAGIDLSFYKHGGSNNLGLPKTGDFLLLPGLMMSLSLAAVAMPLVAFSQLTRKPKFRRKR